MDDPIFHKFTVFSKIDSDGDIVPKLVSCNNCGVTHKIVDICKSELNHGIEDSIAVSSIEDIKSNLPKDLSSILDSHKCDISTWEQVEDIFDNEEWGSRVVISRVSTSDSTQLKCLIIKNQQTYKIETHLRQDSIG